MGDSDCVWMCGGCCCVAVVVGGGVGRGSCSLGGAPSCWWIVRFL